MPDVETIKLSTNNIELKIRYLLNIYTLITDYKEAQKQSDS